MHSFTEKVKWLERIFGRGNVGRTGNLEVWCPFCNDSRKEKKKLAIKVDKDLVHCWVCGYRAKSLLHLIRKFGTVNDYEDYAREYAVDKSRLVDIAPPELTRIELPRDFKLLAETQSAAFDVRACLNYVTSRGLTKEDMWFYKLGFSRETRWHRRIIVPSFDAEGNLNYFTARAIDKKTNKRYDQPEKSKIEVIFNDIYINWKKELTLVEGPFDLFKCPSNSTCLLGSELDENYDLFDKIVENCTPIVLMLDSDAVYKTFKIAERLRSYSVPVKISQIPNDADPGQLTKQQVIDIRDDSSPYSWEFGISAKLARAAKTKLSI